LVFVTVCSRPIPTVRFVGIFVGIVLVSGEQTFSANFAIPNEGIERMARKNDGASANPNTSTARVPVMGLSPPSKIRMSVASFEQVAAEGGLDQP
jgi:hypothetical protein